MVGNRFGGTGAETLEFVKMTSTKGEFRNDTEEIYDYQNITNDGWHHYAMVKSGTEYRWYVDGVFEEKIPVGPINYSETDAIPFNIGGDDNPATTQVEAGEHFTGLIDDVALYDRALTPLEMEFVRQGIHSDLPSTHLEAFRKRHFGTTDGSSPPAADDHDADFDGESNLFEFVTGQDPHAGALVSMPRELNGNEIELRYSRSKAALADGMIYEVEWSETLLEDSWSLAGVRDIPDPANPQTDELEYRVVNVPEGNSGRRFIRLKISGP
jgi:hypothetical protein